MVPSAMMCLVHGNSPGKPGQPTGYYWAEVITRKLGHLRVVHIENSVGTVLDGKGGLETSVPDIPRFREQARALVHNRLEGCPYLIIPARGVEALIEILQGTLSPNMTTRLIGPLEESRDTVARHNYPVRILEVGFVTLPLFLADQDSFQTLLHAFVDILKLLQVLDLLESI